MSSYSPNLFGQSKAILAYEQILEALGIPNDAGIVIGMRPDSLKKITKSKLTRKKKDVLEAMKVAPQFSAIQGHELVLGEYLPEGLLLLAMLFIENGVFISDYAKQLFDMAIDLEMAKLEFIRDEYNRDKRKTQLSHLKNRLDEYSDGNPLEVRMYHSKKGKKRAKKAGRKKLKDRRAAIKPQVTKKDLDMFVETFLLMRMLRGAKETKEAFAKFVPEIDENQLLQRARERGYLDEKNRPNPMFRSEKWREIKGWKP